MKENGMNNKNSTVIQFLKEFDYFRGLTIFFIVLGHIYSFAVRNNHVNKLAVTLKNHWAYFLSYQVSVINGSTALFVFISGFLFYYIFYQRGFVYKDFIKKKFLNVFSPYLVMVLLLYICQIVMKTTGKGSGFFIDRLFFYYSFWYIPFIMTVFLASPLFLKFTEASDKTKKIVLILSLLYSSITVRHNNNPVLSACFWSFFYLLGIYVAQNYEKFKKTDPMNIWSLFFIFIAYATIMLAVKISFRTSLYGGKWNFPVGGNPFSAAKGLLCLILLYLCCWLHTAENRFARIIKFCLSFFAKYSFSIYFMHVFVYFFLKFKETQIQNFLNTKSGLVNHIAIYLTAVVICFVCGFLAMLIKKICGKYSRMLIGS